MPRGVDKAAPDASQQELPRHNVPQEASAQQDRPKGLDRDQPKVVPEGGPWYDLLDDVAGRGGVPVPVVSPVWPVPSGRYP